MRKLVFATAIALAGATGIAAAQDPGAGAASGAAAGAVTGGVVGGPVGAAVGAGVGAATGAAAGAAGAVTAPATGNRVIIEERARPSVTERRCVEGATSTECVETRR